jgi:hypothetical protein
MGKVSAFFTAASGARLHEIRDGHLNCQSVLQFDGSWGVFRYDGDGTYDSQAAMILILWTYLCT